MARSYLDISAIGNEYQAYADTPTTWGMPQDGNGKAGPGSSPAVAIGVIDCTSAVAAGAGTIGVCGQNVSTTLNASGATLAAAIVTAINACATATTATYSQLLLPVKYFVFARQNPGNTAQVQIMTRCAGSDMNFAAGITASGFTTPPTLTQFTGGADGPCAYWVNNAAAFGKAQGAYGLMVAKAPTPYDPSGATDVVTARCARSGTSLTSTLAMVLVAGPNILIPANRQFLFDSNGAVWTGDSGQFTFAISQTGATSGYVAVFGKAGTAAYNLLLDAATYEGFKLTYSAPSISASLSIYHSSNNGTTYVQSMGMVARNCRFEEVNATSYIQFGSSAYNYNQIAGDECHVILRSNHSIVNSSYGARVRFSKSLFEYYGLVGYAQPVISALPLNTSNEYLFNKCRFYDAGNGGLWKVSNGLTTAAGGYNSSMFGQSIQFRECEGILKCSFGMPYGPGISAVWTDTGIDRAFVYDFGYSVVSWISDGTYPGLRTVLPSGTLQSVNMTWPLSISPTSPFYGPSLYAWNQLSAATRTISVDVLTPNSPAITSSDLGLRVRYTDQGGVTRVEESIGGICAFLLGGGVSLSAGSGSWVNTPSGFTARLLSLTTQYAVKQGSEVSCEVVLANTLASATSIYYDPTPVIS